MFNAKFLQQQFRRAKARNATLQQVEADKCGEPKPVAALVDRAGFHAEGNGKQDKATRHNADDAFDIHLKITCKIMRN